MNITIVYCFFQVFSASNVELVTKTRMEHLTEQDKEKCRKNSSKTPIESFLGVAEEHSKSHGASNGVSIHVIDEADRVMWGH